MAASALTISERRIRQEHPTVTQARGRLGDLLAERKTLIAVHRGVGCADIVENTADAMRAAWRSGGDIAELDVVRSADGVYYALHDELEPRLLERSANLGALTAAAIDALEYRNATRQPAGPVNRLADLLAAVRGEGWLNIDRSWRYWDGDFLPLLARFGMTEQIILKAPAADAAALDRLERSGLPFLFMPIVATRAQWRAVRTRKLAFAGVEILFDREDHELLAPDFIASLREAGLFVWVNAICMGRASFNLTAHHDDRGAVLDNPDAHWGWLIDHGATVIQTDFPALLHAYLAARDPQARAPLFARSKPYTG